MTGIAGFAGLYPSTACHGWISYPNDRFLLPCGVSDGGGNGSSSTLPVVFKFSCTRRVSVVCIPRLCGVADLVLPRNAEIANVLRPHNYNTEKAAGPVVGSKPAPSAARHRPPTPTATTNGRRPSSSPTRARSTSATPGRQGSANVKRSHTPVQVRPSRPTQAAAVGSQPQDVVRSHTAEDERQRVARLRALEAATRLRKEKEEVTATCFCGVHAVSGCVPAQGGCARGAHDCCWFDGTFVVPPRSPAGLFWLDDSPEPSRADTARRKSESPQHHAGHYARPRQARAKAAVEAGRAASAGAAPGDRARVRRPAGGVCVRCPARFREP